MKRMAIVSSYNELCGNATYTEVLRKEFSKYYQVEVLPLRTDLLASKKQTVVKLADEHIQDLAMKLKEYDYVNIQFEAGLYGTYRGDIYRRICWLIDACKNLNFTMHRLDIADSLLDKQYLKSLIGGGFFSNLKVYRQKTYMAKLYQMIVKYLKKKSKHNNINIIVHTKREKKNIQQIFQFHQVYDFPITFMDHQMRSRTRSEEERQKFHIKYGLKNEDIVIGLFGFVSEYKGHETAIQALNYLPSQYKIIVFGSQHPMSIQDHMLLDTYLKKLLGLIAKNSMSDKMLSRIQGSEAYQIYLQKRDMDLEHRVIFAGNLNDADFIDALYCCDFAALPYLETNQSGSGIASLVLESKIKSLYSNNKAFFELRKYYPDSFETFDIGNYMELAYKIKNYQKDYTPILEKHLETYNLENNVLFQKSILEKEPVENFLPGITE